MKNTITNWNGERLQHTQYATVDMIHNNNISQDDIKFILRARREKKKALRRRKMVVDTIYFIIAMASFYLFLCAGGVIENSVDIGWNTFFMSMGFLFGGMALAWFCINRGRYLEAIEELAYSILRGIAWILLQCILGAQAIAKRFKKVRVAR